MWDRRRPRCVGVREGLSQAGTFAWGSSAWRKEEPRRGKYCLGKGQWQGSTWADPRPECVDGEVSRGPGGVARARLQGPGARTELGGWGKQRGSMLGFAFKHGLSGECTAAQVKTGASSSPQFLQQEKAVGRSWDGEKCVVLWCVLRVKATGLADNLTGCWREETGLRCRAGWPRGGSWERPGETQRPTQGHQERRSGAFTLGYSSATCGDAYTDQVRLSKEVQALEVWESSERHRRVRAPRVCAERTGHRVPGRSQCCGHGREMSQRNWVGRWGLVRGELKVREGAAVMSRW